MLAMSKVKILGVVVAIATAAWLFAADKPQAEQRANMQKTMKAGNWKDAYEGFRKLALDPKCDNTSAMDQSLAYEGLSSWSTSSPRTSSCSRATEARSGRTGLSIGSPSRWNRAFLVDSGLLGGFGLHDGFGLGGSPAGLVAVRQADAPCRIGPTRPCAAFNLTAN